MQWMGHRRAINPSVGGRLMAVVGCSPPACSKQRVGHGGCREGSRTKQRGGQRKRSASADDLSRVFTPQHGCSAAAPPTHRGQLAAPRGCVAPLLEARLLEGAAGALLLRVGGRAGTRGGGEVGDAAEHGGESTRDRRLFPCRQSCQLRQPSPLACRALASGTPAHPSQATHGAGGAGARGARGGWEGGRRVGAGVYTRCLYHRLSSHAFLLTTIHSIAYD